MEISKIPERIKERRKELDMTQKDLADAMHVSNQLISKWETGESVPSLEYLQQLSEALQTSVNALMGESEPTAPEPAPSEPKEKTPFKAKTFWKAHRKPLIISIVSVASAAVVIAIAFLSWLVFAPITLKDDYIENIDKGIDKYLELGYFNIKHSTELDGDEDKNPRILQGYLDENGNAVYYNSETDEVVKDQKCSHKHAFGQSDYVQPATIKTVSDLLEEQLKTWDEDDLDFNLDEFVSYIRKSVYGYYMEFSEDYFLKDFTPSEKKNIEMETIKGRAEMDGNVTKSIELTVKYRDVRENEKFSVHGIVEFIQEKPEIEHGCYGKQFLEKTGAVSVDASVMDETVEALQSEILRCDNGYVFTYNHSSVTLYDPQTLTEQREIDLSSWYVYSATVYDGAVWFAQCVSDAWKLYRYDLQTNSVQAEFTFERGDALKTHEFNGRYFYVTDCGNDFEPSNSLVFDLETESKVMESTTEFVVYVDKEGTIFYRTRNYLTLHIYGTGTEIEGTKILREDGGIVYTCYGSESKVIYQYERGALKGTIRLPDEFSGYTKDYYFVSGENKVYDNKSGDVVFNFSEAKLHIDDDSKEKTFSRIRIRALWGDFVAVGFSNSEWEWGEDEYIALYRLGQWYEPVAYTKASEINPYAIKSYRFGGNTYLAVYSDASYDAALMDLLLIQS